MEDFKNKFHLQANVFEHQRERWVSYGIVNDKGVYRSLNDRAESFADAQISLKRWSEFFGIPIRTIHE